MMRLSPTTRPRVALGGAAGSAAAGAREGLGVRREERRADLGRAPEEVGIVGGGERREGEGDCDGKGMLSRCGGGVTPPPSRERE